ncbi:MAG: class I SAM-dependent methyltransferase [Desulfosoma sp.]
MKILDRLLRIWRYRVVAPHIPRRCVLLDIGGHDGSFLYFLQERIQSGFCLDPLCPNRTEGRIHFLRGSACARIPLPDASVDVITMLAVLEHVDDKDSLAAEAFRVLRKGGRLIATVPHPAVDGILKVLVGLRLADGISAEEHHRFDIRRIPPIFRRHGFALERHARFQLGLNNIFFFQKP